MQLARALAAKADFAGAEALYRGVIEKDKTYQNAYTELYRMFLFQKKPAEAEQVLKLAFEKNPKQFGFLTLLAMHYYGQQRRDDMVGSPQPDQESCQGLRPGIPDGRRFLSAHGRRRFGDSRVQGRHRQGCEKEGDVPEARHRSADAPGQAKPKPPKSIRRFSKRLPTITMRADWRPPSCWTRGTSPKRWRNCRRW